jgi:uncharacterized membrane protein
MVSRIAVLVLALITAILLHSVLVFLIVPITLATTLSHGGRYKHRKSGEEQEEIAQNATRHGGSPGV